MNRRALRIGLVFSALASLAAVEMRTPILVSNREGRNRDPPPAGDATKLPAWSSRLAAFQSENGVNFRGQDGGQIIDGTNTRWRLGIAPCLEILMDLPTYFGPVRGPGSSGFTDVTPAIKWQVSPIPGKIDLSLVAGVALPTGAVNIAGPGAQPYLQLPWSWELHDGWGLSGMFTEFFRPD